MQFVPQQHLSKPAPCRYIPLDERNRTLHDLYITEDKKVVEQAMQRWLVSTIDKLQNKVLTLAEAG